jgi:hypothetical protein
MATGTPVGVMRATGTPGIVVDVADVLEVVDDGSNGLVTAVVEVAAVVVATRSSSASGVVAQAEARMRSTTERRLIRATLWHVSGRTL